ncbi:MAG TPA: nuclear transport factor 2 family protein [Actinomycetota bacterium]|nr:nuclear transport factor 2 family protein [Actinomycetota bacterium]
MAEGRTPARTQRGSPITRLRSSLARGWAWLLAGAVLGAGAAFLLVLALTDGGSDAEQLTQRWMVAIEHRDLDALEALYAEESTWDDQALDDHFEGRLGVRRGWGIFDFPGFEVRDLEEVAVDDRGAVVLWTLAGDRSPFTGEPWEVTGVSALRFGGGQIVAETVYYDSADLMQ